MQTRQQLISSLLTEAAYSISTAPSSNIVKSVQSKVYTLLHQRIHTAYPSDILCFPHQDTPTSSKYPIWLITLDPFHHEQAHQSHCFSISIAIAQCGELHCGFVYDVSANKLYHAKKGQGAYLNEELLYREEIIPLNEAKVRIDSPFVRDSQPRKPAYVQIASNSFPTALEICHVVEGETDLYLTMSQSPHAFAAASLIAQEAGIRLMTMEGEKVDWSKRSSLWCGVV
ncbi:inositol monophosphatase family protein [Shouchella patagoniensis]|uniref:inositol monophosphatase family protein n=1 Tax=Shouchella patagoniensis TaxID=228576 RepID=UPI0009957E68|nr:inositol monophosphatase family protein [Shouchella patagoniensis]